MMNQNCYLAAEFCKDLLGELKSSPYPWPWMGKEVEIKEREKGGEKKKKRGGRELCTSRSF